MPTVGTVVTFAGAALAILVMPGPSVVYVMSRSITDGRRAGLYSMLGLETGALLHACLAAAGVAAILASSDGAYAAVRYGGAAYLLYLGVRELRAPVGNGFSTEMTSAATRLRLYRDGILVDLLNPKTALFFLAFLPQFVDPTRGSESGQMIALGGCFVALAMVCDSGYAVTAGSLGHRIRSSVKAQRCVTRASGCLYMGLATLACLA